ncbi:uncharacterized protein LOC131236558 [Magnolia sinica]|uniref:uncharacterized protein LOC131236558 n=1 Tax=Magnolia sinica TaxID=86752 RepID=UPI00265992AB|nr:uncharacterized protein LOC131236558 [Magnolia sinica]
MFSLQPGMATGHHSDRIVTTNGHLGRSNGVESGTQSPRIARNYDSYSNSSDKGHLDRSNGVEFSTPSPRTARNYDSFGFGNLSGNGYSGQSKFFEFGSPNPKFSRNYDSFGNSSEIQHSTLSWKMGRCYDNSGYSSGMEADALTQGVARQPGKFGNSSRIGFGTVTERIARRYDGSVNSGGIEFHARKQTEEDSDGSSPPLWKTSPPVTPTTEASSPSHRAHLSPNSRLQAIARGRRELMEMIQDMPESNYELSLKDIVEPPATGGFEETVNEDERALVHETIQEEKTTNRKKRHGRGRDLRGTNTENGAILLKMFFPASLGSKKRSSSTSTCSKVSPKPMPVEEKSVDGEWWKKKFSVVGENDRSRTNKSSRSSSSSSNSSSNSSRRMGGFLPSCWSFFNTSKSKGRGHKGCLF